MGATVEVNNSNFLQTNFEQSKLILGENRFADVEFTASGADIELTRGMLIGKIAATQKGKILASASTDGSEIPFGIVCEDVTIADGTTQTVSVAISGDISQNLLVLDGSDTLATLVDGRSIGDRIMADTLGIKLVLADELSGYDN